MRKQYFHKMVFIIRNLPCLFLRSRDSSSNICKWASFVNISLSLHGNGRGKAGKAHGLTLVDQGERSRRGHLASSHSRCLMTEFFISLMII